MGVHRSGYDKWTKRSNGERRQRQTALLSRILEIFEESRRTYGCPRIWQQLKREGWRVAKRTVERIMRQHGIQPKRRRAFKSTTDSKHSLPVSDNVVKRQFAVVEPNHTWVSDITYIQTHEGWLYLAVFIDLVSRKVVGWSMSDQITADLVNKAYDMATFRRSAQPRVVHSDRGIQYAAQSFRGRLGETKQSMSRKGNCCDNAVAESFFGSLKSELIYHHTFVTREQAAMSIFDYIEIFYNRRRLHSTLNYLSPEEFEDKSKTAA